MHSHLGKERITSIGNHFNKKFRLTLAGKAENTFKLVASHFKTDKKTMQTMRVAISSQTSGNKQDIKI